MARPSRQVSDTGAISIVVTFNVVIVVVIISHKVSTIQHVFTLAKIFILAVLPYFNSIRHVLLSMNQPVAVGDAPSPFLRSRLYEIHDIGVSRPWRSIAQARGDRGPSSI
uniref:Uncharacterized protein n=1 Tax=Arundo donax TaxID=35708 RepID=A0A0A9F2Z1_ARUDO